MRAKKPRVLVVEHDPEARQLFLQALAATGVEAKAVTSVPELDRVVEQEKFDGIIFDWATPGLVIRKQVERIRRSRWNYATPVIAMAEGNTRQAMNESFRAGVMFFLSKPLNASKIERLLAVSRGRILEERRAYQRAPVALPVEGRCGQQSFAGTSVNISSRGMLLKGHPGCPNGTRVDLTFSLPASEQSKFNLSGQVVRVTPQQEMGIHFLNVSQEKRRLIADYVDHFLEKSQLAQAQPAAV